jgi:hypothetical protein
MSQWRHEASDRLPELQRMIASPAIRSPADLWSDLRLEFDRLCHQEPAPTNLLSRIWQYGRWCMEHQDEAVSWAAINGFFGNLKDTRCYREILPKFMSGQEYEQFTDSRRDR